MNVSEEKCKVFVKKVGEGKKCQEKGQKKCYIFGKKSYFFFILKKKWKKKKSKKCEEIFFFWNKSHENLAEKMSHEKFGGKKSKKQGKNLIKFNRKKNDFFTMSIWIYSTIDLQRIGVCVLFNNLVCTVYIYRSQKCVLFYSQQFCVWCLCLSFREKSIPNKHD